MSSIDDVIHFFEMEIEACRKRAEDDSEYFNGVSVTQCGAVLLNLKHIEFCQNIIDRIRSDSL